MTMQVTPGGSSLRVLLLAQWYDPIIGGEEIHVRTLAHSLASRGHHVTVAALSHPGRPSDYWDGDVHVYRIRAAVQRIPKLFADPARQSAPPFPDPGVSAALRRIVARERPNIVHAHNWIVQSYLPVRDAGVPLIVTLHDYSFTCAKKVLLYRGRPCSGPEPAKCLRCASAHYGPVKGPITLAGLWSTRPALLRAVDCFVGVSQAVITASGIAQKARHAVIPNFLPDGFGATTEDPPGSLPLPDEPFLLFVGSLSRIKGIEPLLEAYRALPDVGRPALVMIGYTGSERLAVLDHPPAGVTVITDQPRSVVAATWRRSLFGVVPSICPEAFGIVALEAMAVGRPVVASRIGGLEDLVEDGASGLLVDPGNPVALREAIARLVADDELRRRLGAGARRRAAQFSAGQVVPEIERLYRETMELRELRSSAPLRVGGRVGSKRRKSVDGQEDPGRVTATLR